VVLQREVTGYSLYIRSGGFTHASSHRTSRASSPRLRRSGEAIITFLERVIPGLPRRVASE